MNPTGSALGYDAAPPISAPLRYFLSAPAFGVLGGLMLMLAPELLASRWTPGALALTHLITVGFLVMVMIGALFQVLPVVCGAAIPMARMVSGAVHVFMVGGTLALVTGLYTMQPPTLILAAALLGVALAIFLFSAMIGLAKVSAGTGSQRDMRLALIGLGVAVMVGLALVMTRAHGLPLPLFNLLQLHLGWALLGGAGVLLAATSWIIVPMFQITPPYPKLMTRFWAMSCTITLLLWSFAVYFEQHWLSVILLALVAGLAGVFLITTLITLTKTRRSKPDASFRVFRFGIWNLTLGLVCLLATYFSDAALLRIVAGVLILYGGFVSVIQGMLYKIVPFLAWLHLTQSGIKAPNVRLLQPEQRASAQLRAHGLAIATLVVAAASGNDWMIRLAGAVVVVEFAWLGANMVGVLSHYRRARHEAPARRHSHAV